MIPRWCQRLTPPGSPALLPWQTPGTPGSPPRPISLTLPTHLRRAPPVVRPRACGADLLRWIRAHGTGGPLVLGLDAAHRRADVVLLRMRVR